ncbi:MAG: DUF5615 family PIN-like protein [Alphaproteobacteria bacterium]|nr:DUF5615 family PIN-like protein [Alphaproteobacteria bacterium]
MRCLIDAQRPPALADWLKSKGHDAEHVFERLGTSRSDTLIARMSSTVNCVVVSKDADFFDLQKAGKPQILWVRIGNSTNRHLIECFEAEWPRLLAEPMHDEPVVEID